MALLIDPKLPKRTRVIIYGVFSILVVAVLVLGFMSIGKSISDFSHVGEGAGELKHVLEQEVDERFNEKNTNQEETYASEEKEDNQEN